MAEGLRENGFGRIVSCELDPVVFAKAQEKIAASGLGEWIDLQNVSSLDLKTSGQIDLFFSDSDLDVREKEVRQYLPKINPNGLILMHDAASHPGTVRDAALRLESEGLISVVLLPTPRGLAIAQRREGRK
jgi:predicted O-methyltransferase YrrM